LNYYSRFGRFVSALKIPFPGNGDFGSKRRGSNAGLSTQLTAREVGLPEAVRIAHNDCGISEVLRAVANSAHDLQPIFETIVDSATQLDQGGSYPDHQ
jgi:hypothetical protein